MPQDEIWEKEYKNPKFITKGEYPQKDTLRFFKFLKKYENVELSGLSILDLGSGTGRNANYLASQGNQVVGLEISHTAIKLARQRADEMGVSVNYQLSNIGDKYPFEDEIFDIVLDVTSSNSLTEKERKVYIEEVYRTLKPGRYFFVRALALEGDKNAKALLKKSPGKELGTYIIPEIKLTERVFSRMEFEKLYSQYFTLLKLFKKTNYAKFNNQNYKRNYWLAYLKK